MMCHMAKEYHIMSDINDDLRLLLNEKQALMIADEIYTFLRTARSYYESDSLTEEGLNAFYNTKGSDPFAELHNSRFSGSNVNELLESLRVKLRAIRCFDANQICDYWHKTPEHMNQITDEAYEEYKRLKLIVSQHVANL